MNIPSLIIEGIRNLFIPPENFFSNMYDGFKQNLSTKIDYDTYLDVFNSLADGSLYSGNRDINIDINNYQVADGFSLSMDNFVDFSFITQYRDTWVHWVRGVVFILIILYNLNEVIKLLTGYGLSGVVSAMKGGGKE